MLPAAGTILTSATGTRVGVEARDAFRRGDDAPSVMVGGVEVRGRPSGMAIKGGQLDGEFAAGSGFDDQTAGDVEQVPARIVACRAGGIVNYHLMRAAAVPSCRTGANRHRPTLER